MRDAGFDRPAFETIVASGPNSALPHARPTEPGGWRPGTGVVLDFGGVYDGYCVDLTRTVSARAVPPSVSPAVRGRPGGPGGGDRGGAPGRRVGADVDAAARSVLARHGLGEAFGHGTGHGLGLEVHEEPRSRRQSRRRDEPLRAGMVFTIEPGAYVPGSAASGSRTTCS